MNLVVIQNRQAVTTSLQVAESFEKEVKHVNEAIRNLTVENSAVKNFFYEGTYTNSRGREYPMYYMNRDGFTLLAMGFTGQKAIQFKLAYIQAFNEMEQQIQHQLPQDPITLALEAALETRKTVQTIQSEVKEVKANIEDLRDNLVITTLQAKSLRKKVGEKVYEALGGKESNAFKHMRAKLFAECWNDFKNYFGLSEYRELPRVKYEQGMKFLLAWAPSTESRLEIEHYNTQIELKLVK